MLFNDVLAILNCSREKGVDILVARDMILAEDRTSERKNELFSACNFIGAFYDFITDCRVANDDESIKDICELYEKGDILAVRKYIKDKENK